MKIGKDWFLPVQQAFNHHLEKLDISHAGHSKRCMAKTSRPGPGTGGVGAGVGAGDASGVVTGVPTGVTGAEMEGIGDNQALAV